VKLVAIVEPDTTLAQKYEEQFHLDHSLFFSRLQDAVAQQHPQALLVYTPVGEHRKVIEQAAALSVSVMVEKPLTLSVADALAIRRAAREHHIQVLTNYETTWYASNRAVAGMVADGKLGEIRKVVVHDGHQGPQEIHVQPEFLAWLTDPVKNGAGALFDFGCYGANLMTWLMHGEKPLAVMAVTQQIKPDVYPKVDDEATIIVTYPKAQGIIQASWNWPYSRKDMEVYALQGYVIADRNGIKLKASPTQPEENKLVPPPAKPYHDPFAYLASVVRGDIVMKSTDLSSLQNNLIVVEILEAAKESAKQGKIVYLKK